MSSQALERILDLARWAPSGDNTQPWRFEIVDDFNIAVYGHDTRDNVLYDFDGHASHMAHGGLLETIRIAASLEGMLASWEIDPMSDDRLPIYRVSLNLVNGLDPDPLSIYIQSRVVQRRPMRSVPLSDDEKSTLMKSVGEPFELHFFETLGSRLSLATLLWKSAYLRLVSPEAYLVHKHVIEWGAQFSKDRIPEQAVGVDPFTARLMRWVMQSWERVDFFNKYAFGTILPRIQLDLLPAIMCSSHVLIQPKNAPSTLMDWVLMGGAMQRFWLTATALGYYVQPEMTPVIFRWYTRTERQFSQKPGIAERASVLALEFEKICRATPDTPFGFFARLGQSARPASRSLRVDLEKLMK